LSQLWSASYNSGRARSPLPLASFTYTSVPTCLSDAYYRGHVARSQSRAVVGSRRGVRGSRRCHLCPVSAVALPVFGSSFAGYCNLSGRGCRSLLWFEAWKLLRNRVPR
jgi:hypothetical protein